MQHSELFDQQQCSIVAASFVVLARSGAMWTRGQTVRTPCLTPVDHVPACRVKTVPLVCRAWRDAARAPSIMWERVRLSLTVLGGTQILGNEVSGEVYHPSKLAPWLAARSRSIHTLFVCILNDAAALHMTEGCVSTHLRGRPHPCPLLCANYTTLTLHPHPVRLHLERCGRAPHDRRVRIPLSKAPSQSLPSASASDTVKVAPKVLLSPPQPLRACRSCIAAHPGRSV